MCVQADVHDVTMNKQGNIFGVHQRYFTKRKRLPLCTYIHSCDTRAFPDNRKYTPMLSAEQRQHNIMTHINYTYRRHVNPVNPPFQNPGSTTAILDGQVHIPICRSMLNFKSQHALLGNLRLSCLCYFQTEIPMNFFHVQQMTYDLWIRWSWST